MFDASYYAPMFATYLLLIRVIIQISSQGRSQSSLLFLLVLGLAALILAVLDPPRVSGRVDILKLVEAIPLFFKFIEVDLIGDGYMVCGSFERIGLSNILVFCCLTFFVISHQLFLEEIDGFFAKLGLHHSGWWVVEVHVHQGHHAHVHVEGKVGLLHHVQGRVAHGHLLPDLTRMDGSQHLHSEQLFWLYRVRGADVAQRLRREEVEKIIAGVEIVVGVGEETVVGGKLRLQRIRVGVGGGRFWFCLFYFLLCFWSVLIRSFGQNTIFRQTSWIMTRLFCIFILSLPGICMGGRGLSLLGWRFMIPAFFPDLFAGLQFCNLFLILNLFLNLLGSHSNLLSFNLLVWLTLHEGGGGLSSIEQFIIDII